MVIQSGWCSVGFSFVAIRAPELLMLSKVASALRNSLLSVKRKIIRFFTTPRRADDLRSTALNMVAPFPDPGDETVSRKPRPHPESLFFKGSEPPNGVGGQEPGAAAPGSVPTPPLGRAPQGRPSPRSPLRGCWEERGGSALRGPPGADAPGS